MKWTEKSGPNQGDIRTKRQFLFWPKFVYGEWRWLELATWTERYKSSYDGMYWDEIEWIDKKPREAGKERGGSYLLLASSILFILIGGIAVGVVVFSLCFPELFALLAAIAGLGIAGALLLWIVYSTLSGEF